MTSTRRTLGLWAAATAVLAALALTAPTAAPRGKTTLDRTILDLNGDGRLEFAEGEPLAVRDDLGVTPPAGRDLRRQALASFVGFTDFQLADEESPVRGPWLDKCTDHPAEAAFRPQESMVPHLINSNIRAADAIGAGPVTHRPFDFGIQLGDAADNTQRNEIRWVIDLLDGGRLIDPDSGNREQYEGPQGADPWPSPNGRSILELANDPFWAPGLRRANGEPIPWYSVLGNHDTKIQGTITNLPGWWEFIRTYIQGPVFIRDLAPDYQQALCANPALAADPAFWTKVITRPGTTSLVTPDPDRITLTRLQWMAEHLPPDLAKELDPMARGSTGLPAGHGFLDGRCTDAEGKILDRLCYTFDREGIHFIVLDTNPDEGLDGGNIDAGQLAWLERDLIVHSTRYYDAAGNLQENPAGRDQLIVFFSHHTRDTIAEEATECPLCREVRLKTTDHATTDRIDSDGRAFAEEFSAMLLRFPNVIMHGAGHTHENRVWARNEGARPAVPAQGLPATGYWEVNSSSHADWPHQSRTFEIVDNHDGTLSIFGVMFDATAAPKACRGDSSDAADEDGVPCLAWEEDPTHEQDHGAPANVNEEYLAAVAREVGYNDPQAGNHDALARGRPDVPDRNVEMLILNPLTAAGSAVEGARVPALGGPGTTSGIGTFPTQPILDTAVPHAGSSFTDARPAGIGTSPGIGSPATRGALSGRAVRGWALLAVALVALGWLFRARVRGWMLGLSAR